MTAAADHVTAALNARWADALVGALCASGVGHAVVSPGSRNTPIVLALAARAERGTVQVHAILDERAAAFYALGLARVVGSPVALSCTSGSAGAHWLPAVIEADHSRLPLLLLTADRPPELHGSGAPQTVRQDDLFGRHVRLHADPGAPTPGDLGWLRTLAARAVGAATGPRPGPVHLNLPLREPLWEAALTPVEPVDDAPRLLRPTPPALDARTVSALADELRTRRRGVIAIGPGDSGVSGASRADHLERLATAARHLAAALDWPLIVDGASGARFAPAGTHLITTADLLTRCEAFAATPPDAVLRVGQVATSKPVAAWLASAPGDATLLVDPSGDWHDPHHRAGRLITAEPATLMTELADALTSGPQQGDDRCGEWLHRWQAAEVVALAAAAGDGESGLWSGTVARSVVSALPEGALLHVASSLAVRSLDSFSGTAARHLVVTANRGANGIDGTLATALGEAAAWRSGPVVVLVGDLAFLHDLGALISCRAPLVREKGRSAAPTTLVVVDNRGGGIFDHLPVAGHPSAYEPYFVVGTDADIPALARAAGAACSTVTDRPGFDQALAEAIERPGLTVVHARVDRANDLAHHVATRAAVARALGEGAT